MPSIIWCRQLVPLAAIVVDSLAFLTAGNNTNSPGFSFGEISKMFGNGGGVNFSSNGSFSIGGRSFGGGAGITTSQNAGLN